MSEKQRIRKSSRLANVAPASVAARDRRERQISALYELWRSVPHTNTERLLQMVAERATAAMDAHTCSILLREKGGDTMRVIASVGLAQDVADSVTMLVGERIAGRVAASGLPVLVNNDPSTHPLFTTNDGTRPHDISARPEVESALCSPLVAADGAVHGVLCLSRHTPAAPFTDADLRVCSLFAAQAGSVVAQTRIVEDLTIAGQEAAHMEREMERTASLAALGQLAASVAHELRNPLSSIKGAAQFLLKEFSGESASNVPGGAERAAMLEDFLNIVVEEVDGLGRLTTDLLEFARPAPPQRARQDLREIVAAELSFLRPELVALGVSSVEEVYAVNNPPYAEVDAQQIGRALRNLLLNAAQAMSTRSGVAAENVITVLLQRSLDPAGYAIVVEDNGPGIPERVLGHLWEPFFTTKARGSGLGLAHVRQVISAHGGSVSADNVRTGGARFVLYLPGIAPSATLPTPLPRDADGTSTIAAAVKLNGGSTSPHAG